MGIARPRKLRQDSLERQGIASTTQAVVYLLKHLNSICKIQTPNCKSMVEAIADWDTPWKEALELYFAEFLQFFFPWIHDNIDWSKPCEFLDKELQQVIRDAERGRRLVDKLVKVWRLNGEETWVLIHLEIQGQQDIAFPKRMYVYHYRIEDRYDRPVVSLAVLTDDQAHWRPHQYTFELWGCRVSLKSLSCWMTSRVGRIWSKAPIPLR